MPPVQDLSDLYQRPAGTAQRAPLIPSGSAYRVRITGFDGGKNTNGNRYVRWFFTFTDWDPSISEDLRAGVNLDSYQRMYCDLFWTADNGTRENLIILDDFLKNFGVKLPADGSRKYEDALPEVIGSDALAEIDTYLPNGAREDDRRNVVRRLVPAPSEE